MKDRSRYEQLAEDVRILAERSSTHPIEYAIVLLARRSGRWQTVRTFDNAHAPDEHHEHRYTASHKHEPIIHHGPVNPAMNSALESLRKGWPDIVRSWEQR